MWNKPALQVANVGPGNVATLRIQPEAATLVNVLFTLAGTTFDTSHITRVKVKIGPRTIWDLTGPQLLAINAYKNGNSNNKFLLLDFTERDQAGFPVKELGGIDLMRVLAVGEVTVELTIAAGASAPQLTATLFCERQQGNTGVLKYLPFTATQSAAGRFTLPIQPRGALMKRLFNFYSGTNWTGTANGNVSRMENKKNGLTFHDQTCLEVRYTQAQLKKVPQANLYVADFIVDNNPAAMVATMRQTDQGMVYDAFEFNTYLTDAGGATCNLILEAIDDVTNL